MKGAHSAPRPGDAIKTLECALQDPRVEYKRAYVSIDLTDFHVPFSDDDLFANAVLAVVREIKVALRDPAKYGKRLSGREACLRLVIEPVPGGGIRIYGFRHRHRPSRAYSVVNERLSKRKWHRLTR